MSEERLGRIESKIDRLAEKQSEMNAILSRQNVTLEEHVRRTENLEARVQPLEIHVQKSAWMTGSLVKLIGLGAAVAAILGFLFPLLKG